MAMIEHGHLLSEMRSLSAADPKSARETLKRLLSVSPGSGAELLRQLTCPEDARVRHVAASLAVRGEFIDLLRPVLTEWQALETDEFTRNAIKRALDCRTPAPQKSIQIDRLGEVETYRYVSQRLCHRVRNRLLRPAADLMALEAAIAKVQAPEEKILLKEAATRLRDGLREIGRQVEFPLDDDYFTWSIFDLPSWLREAQQRFGPARTSVNVVGDGSHCIRASSYLLDIVFSNLWSNAVQASAPSPCSIEATIDTQGSHVCLLLTDNGPGFEARHIEDAFSTAFSTNGRHRGRGLLEVADAIARLGGAAKLVPLNEVLRVNLFFPVVAS